MAKAQRQQDAIEKQLTGHFGDKAYAVAIAREIMYTGTRASTNPPGIPDIAMMR